MWPGAIQQNIQLILNELIINWIMIFVASGQIYTRFDQFIKNQLNNELHSFRPDLYQIWLLFHQESIEPWALWLQARSILKLSIISIRIDWIMSSIASGQIYIQFDYYFIKNALNHGFESFGQNLYFIWLLFHSESIE